MSDPVVQLEGLTRSFVQGDVQIDVLRGANMTIAPGEIVALLGPSGSGKSTLLQAVGLLEGGFGGKILISGTDASHMDGDERTTLRRDTIGFVYQFHHLLPDFTAIENVIIPQLIANRPRDEAEDRAKELLGALGLAERLDHKPSQLSGGEQQRVAIARATVSRPPLIFADEPTGNLDAATGAQIIDLLFARRAETSATLIIITHDEHLAARCQRVVTLADGRIVSDTASS